MATDRGLEQQTRYEARYQCSLCSEKRFRSVRDFQSHLRAYHCLKEGGSYVCKYGPNEVCRTLPIEGVNDRDYGDHLVKHHAPQPAPLAHRPVKSSEPGTTDGKAHPRKLSLVSNASLDSLGTGRPWSGLEARINISSLLNDPRLVKRQGDFFTKTWGEQFETCAKLHYSPVPIINREDFQNYFRKVSSKLKARKRAAQSVTEAPLPIDVFPPLYTRVHDKARQDLEEVPKIYTQPTFTLHDPNTFDEALPWSQIKSGDRCDKLLQEKLTHYLDIVEEEISRQVALKSDAFFHVMTSHKELHSRLASTLNAVKAFRMKMNRLDHILDLGPLKAMGLKRRQSICAHILNKLHLMATVHQAQPTVQALLATSDYVGALDMIATTQDVLRTELAGVTAFRHLGSQLGELSRLIATMMQQDFSNAVTAFLNRPIGAGGAKETTESGPKKPRSDTHAEEDKLAAIVLGMIRQDNIQFVDLLRDEAATTIKTVVKQTAIEVISVHVSDDQDGKLPDQLRLLTFASWMELLQCIFTNLVATLSRIKVLCGIVHKVLDGAAGRRGSTSATYAAPVEGPPNGVSPTVTGGEDEEEEEETEAQRVERAVSFTMSDHDLGSIISTNTAEHIQEQLAEILCSMGDRANDRLTKVFTAKAKDGFMGRLTSTQFTDMALAVEQFSGECERVCGRRSNSLRGYIQSQASKFVSVFHEDKKKMLVGVLESERWKSAEVPADLQSLVSLIESSQSFSPSDSPDGPSTAEPAQAYIRMGGQQYVIVGSVVVLLRLIIQYCQCIERIPSVAADMLSRLIDILKIFNARSSQLILGAGALQVAGLKTISTKNLALLSRSLQLIEAYVPTVKAHFSLYVPESKKSQLRYFDHLQKEYSEHNGVVLQKLTEIMDQMLEGMLKQYDVKAPVPSSSFRSICKQLNKFHEAISDVLPETHVRNLFMKVNTLFRDKLRRQLQTLRIHKSSGPLQGLVMAELAFYQQNFNSLRGLTNANISASLKSVWT